MTAPGGGFDPRLTAAREDLARAGLEGRVAATRFVDPLQARVTVGRSSLRRRPSRQAPLDTEVLFGETVAVLDEREGWCWVQLDRDGYVGYVEETALARQSAAPTHRVKALGTFVYPEPSIKAPPVDELPLGAFVRIVEIGESLSRLQGGGFIATRHSVPLDRYERDFVDVAERFIGTPYLWGGRTRHGLDCSGLVQTALHAAGFIDTPRDSDQQERSVGSTVLIPEQLDGLRRGDLVFWKGHVGVMADDVMLLHANAHHMSVVVEPLATAVARIGRTTGPITGIRRLAALTAARQSVPDDALA